VTGIDQGSAPTADAATDPYAAVIGQPRAVAALRAAAVNPVHAYLLVGPHGSGARPLARAFAAQLLSAGLDGADAERAVRLALAEKHPDLHVAERAGPFIVVGKPEALEPGSARWIVREAAKAPIEGDRQVFVLVDFHLIQVAGPALLKAIEEPNPSTFFIVLAEAVPPELVAIASRCVRIDLDPVPLDDVVGALVAEGCAPDVATAVAIATAGDLDRARLLATDERFSLRRRLWYDAPQRLDGNGSTVWQIVAELRGAIDDAQAPLDARHARELVALEERIERYGERGGGRRDLTERHRREVRRHRTDELRFGLATLAARYRDELASGKARGVAAQPLLAAIAALDGVNEALIRNPGEVLLLQALLLELPTGAHLPSFLGSDLPA